MEKKNTEYRVHLKPNKFLQHKQNLQKKLEKYEEDYAKTIRDISAHQKVLSSSLSSESEHSVSTASTTVKEGSEGSAAKTLRTPRSQSSDRNSKGTRSSVVSRKGARQSDILPTKAWSFPVQTGSASKRTTNIEESVNSASSNRQKRTLRRQKRVDRFDIPSNLHFTQRGNTHSEKLSVTNFVNDQKDKHQISCITKCQQQYQDNKSIKPGQRSARTESSEKNDTNDVQENTIHMAHLSRHNGNHPVKTNLQDKNINKNEKITSVDDISRTVLERPMNLTFSRKTRSTISARETVGSGRARSETFSGESNKETSSIWPGEQVKISRDTLMKYQYLSYYHGNAWSAETNENTGEKIQGEKPSRKDGGKQYIAGKQEDSFVKKENESNASLVNSVKSSDCKKDAQNETESYVDTRFHERDISHLNRIITQESDYKKDECSDIRDHNKQETETANQREGYKDIESTNHIKGEKLEELSNLRRKSANQLQGQKQIASANQIKADKLEELSNLRGQSANQLQGYKDRDIESTNQIKGEKSANQIKSDKLEDLSNLRGQSANQLQGYKDRDIESTNQIKGEKSANQIKADKLEELDNLSTQSANQLQGQNHIASANHIQPEKPLDNLPRSKGWRKIQEIPLAKLQQLNSDEINDEKGTLKDFKDKSVLASPGLLSFRQVVLAAIKKEQEKKAQTERNKRLLHKERMAEIQQPTESFLRQTIDKAVHRGYVPTPPSGQTSGGVKFRTVVTSLQGFSDLSQVVSGNRLKRAERIRKRSDGTLPYTRKQELLSQEEKTVGEMMKDVEECRYLRNKNSLSEQ